MPTDIRDPFALLGVTPQSSDQEIHAAWRLLMKHAQPEAGGSHEYAAALNRALDTLLDPQARFDFVMRRRNPPPRPPRPEQLPPSVPPARPSDLLGGSPDASARTDAAPRGPERGRFAPAMPHCLGQDPSGSHLFDDWAQASLEAVEVVRRATASGTTQSLPRSQTRPIRDAQCLGKRRNIKA